MCVSSTAASRRSLSRAPREAVDARVEVEVLAHREVVVERELLAHVADAPADLLALRRDVEAEHAGACPRVGARRPQRMRMSVDLPEPFGPSRP